MASDQAKIALNGFRVGVHPGQFTVFVRDLPDASGLDELRAAAGDRWRLWWNRGLLYELPRDPGAVRADADEKTLDVRDHLGFVAFLINTALPDAIPHYQAFRNRPFTFLALKREFVQEIKPSLPGAPQLLQQFTIRPRYALEARVVEPAEEAFIGLFVTLTTRYGITADLQALAEAGVELSGLDVVRRDPAPGQRRLVGRIDRIAGEEVLLAESFDHLTRIPAREVTLEGSRDAFTACLRVILDGRYNKFEAGRQRLEGELLGGPGIDTMLTQMGSFLADASPITLGAGLECSVGDRLTAGNTGTHRGVHRAAPMSYCFDPARAKQDRLAWRGLARYGPFSRDSFATRSPQILVVAPESVQGTTEAFVRALRDGAPNTAYPGGFAATFRLANPAFTLQKVAGAGRPHEAYRRAIEAALSAEQRPDAAIVVIPDEHADLPDAVNPYLHAKSLLLMAGVPSQQMRVSTMRQPAGALAYTLQNASVALYAKLNGVPWTVDHHLPIADEIVIGLGIAELAASRYHDRQRYMGVTTVFRGDGNYLLGSLSRECSFEEYPQMLQASVQDVLTEVKQRNGWKPGDTVRVVCHTSLPMRERHLDRLIAGTVAAVGAEQNVEFAFLTVGDRQPFTMLEPGQPGKQARGQRKGVFAPERGTIVQISPTQRLLAITGPDLIKRAGAALPRQLHVRLQSASTFRDLDYLTEQVLKFTSLSWRSTLPAGRPVTTYYSALMAELLARLRAVPDWSPALLNTRLCSRCTTGGNQGVRRRQLHDIFRQPGYDSMLAARGDVPPWQG